MVKIGIIDIIGIPYDGTTVFKQGLGGSESAVTLVAKELAELGFSVTVFNNCNLDHAQPGIYDQVTYRPLTDLADDHVFDVIISSRTIIPFTAVADYEKLGDYRARPFAPMNLYDRIVSKAKVRILWMHDTFCLGDNLIEELAVSNRITDIFTLSDFHLTYVANCNHGRRRNFEVLKRKFFITRNGINKYYDEVDVAAKDRNLFVYNASVTKGMVPLVTQIWPHVKRHIPEARLKVIGGYYRFSTSSNPDEQEIKWRELANDPKNSALGIEFTGVISQREIADILVAANFMIYPAAFPETFGISTLESIAYNTPAITCRFGALEEIALENACYLIDYAIEPNNLFTDIDVPKQVEAFVKTTVEAYRNPYLHQQKQYYCNIVKDVAGWDSVALQWKQHLYRKLGLYLSRDEYRAVSKINHKVHKIWQRRYHNSVELESYKSSTEQEIVLIVPFYNNKDYMERCIHSIASQDYENYTCILIDDRSTDNTILVTNAILNQLPEDIRAKFKFMINLENQGAVHNQIDHIREIANDDAIVMLLDGDDSLVNDNTVLSYFNTVYDGTTEFTYGSCWSMVDNIPLISQPYPEHVKQAGTYRQHHFNWIMPYTHLRTFKKRLVNGLDDSLFKDAQGNWFKAGGDGSLFYAVIEQADPNKVKCLQEIVYNYNDTNPINDYKVNGIEQNKNAREIVAKMPQVKKKILIAIPTARNIEPETFKSIYDLRVSDEYELTFQYFFGYNIDQVRNLIADWVVKGFDYLFSVDSDIAFTPDTLAKLLAHNVDVVSGMYIQRKPGLHTLELYEHNGHGGVSNIPYEKIKDRGLVEIAGCGFGCVLVKAEVMRAIPYPHFKYHSAIDHRHTISEDVDFCGKVREKGFKMFVDTTIKCRHIGSTEFLINDSIPALPIPAPTVEPKMTPPGIDIQQRLRDLGSQRLIPRPHVEYLMKLKEEGVNPKVIYDIGACVLHWTNEAQLIWPDAEFLAFEAMDTAEFLYKERGLKYHIGVFSDQTGKEVDFYQNDFHPGGNSYYLENAKVNPEAPQYFNEHNRRRLKTVTLDAVVRLKQLPAPDMIKMDVQGAEMDILKGSSEVLQTVKYVILEAQTVEYNTGAPMSDQVIAYMDSIGFACKGLFSSNTYDGDYFFVRRTG
jgi:FkbM family methyltransferase